MKKKNHKFLRKRLIALGVSTSLFASYIGYGKYQDYQESQLYRRAHTKLVSLYQKSELNKDYIGHIITPIYIYRNKNNVISLFHLSATTNPDRITFTMQGKNLEFFLGASKIINGDIDTIAVLYDTKKEIIVRQGRKSIKSLSSNTLKVINQHFNHTIATHLNGNFKKYKEYNPDIEIDMEGRIRKIENIWKSS